eukprot:6192505-Pleurochrysis_carterae.AAC.1
MGSALASIHNPLAELPGIGIFWERGEERVVVFGLGGIKHHAFGHYLHADSTATSYSRLTIGCELRVPN